jgi:hypothetical protein
MEPGGKEGNTPQAAALEVPTDTNDGADLVRDGTDDDRTPLSRVLPGGSPLPVSALPQIDEMEVNAQVEGTVRGQPLEESDQKPVTDCCLHASQADMCMMDEGECVTSEAAEPAFSACGHVGVPGLTERVTKMLTGVEGGPVASGGGRAADQLNIQDLRDIRDAVNKLKISKNAAVKAACGSLDDQEGRGWLGADLLGVTLVHSYKAPTEAHTVGQQIDDKLSDAKVHVDRLKGAARKRKTDARKKGLGEEELAGKLTAIDEKLARDLHDYARMLVDIELPKGAVEVKRERPSPPAPAPSDTEKRLRDAVRDAEDAAAVADCDLVAARRVMERADAVRAELQEERVANATGGWKLEDEAYTELLAHRAELDAAWDRQVALESELRQEYADALLRQHDARFAAEEARHDLDDHRRAVRREAELAAQLEAARAADAARRAAAGEAERLRRHADLMAFYDTLSPEELHAYVQARGRIRNEEIFKDSPLRQPLAPGAPRVYDLRGDPSSWQLPSLPP